MLTLPLPLTQPLGEKTESKLPAGEFASSAAVALRYVGCSSTAKVLSHVIRHQDHHSRLLLRWYTCTQAQTLNYSRQDLYGCPGLNTIINPYGPCLKFQERVQSLHNRVQFLISDGELDEASVIACRSALCDIPPCVYTCNTILAGMYNTKRYEDVISLFQLFHSQSKIVPDIVSYIILINAYEEGGYRDECEDVYEHILDQDESFPVYTPTHDDGDSVQVDGDCCSISHTYALSLAGFLPFRNSPTKNPYIPCLRLHDRVQSLHNRVQSLIRAGDNDKAFAIACRSAACDIPPSVSTCNIITASMYDTKRYEDVISIFQFFHKQSNITPDLVSYSILINAYCDTHRDDQASQVRTHILAHESFPIYTPSHTLYTNPRQIKDLVAEGRIEAAVSLLDDMNSYGELKGHVVDTMMYNTVIAGCLSLDDVDKANELFDELVDRENEIQELEVVYATFMDYFFKEGVETEAMEWYWGFIDWEPEPRISPKAGNTFLKVFLKYGKTQEAWTLFDKMLDDHRPPEFLGVNPDTFTILINECFNLGKFSEAIEVFNKSQKGDLRLIHFAMDGHGYNNIISKLCDNGMLSEAEKIFTDMYSAALDRGAGMLLERGDKWLVEKLSTQFLTPADTTYQILIDAYLKAGRMDDALSLFNKMREGGRRANASFANRMFDELVQNGKVMECAQFLGQVVEEDSRPDSMSYEIVIRALCNENLLDAQDLLEEMVRCDVDISPGLREFLLDTFGKVSRRCKMEFLICRKFNPQLYPEDFGKLWRPATPTS